MYFAGVAVGCGTIDREEGRRGGQGGQGGALSSICDTVTVMSPYITLSHKSYGNKPAGC